MTPFCGPQNEGLVPFFTRTGISPCFVESFLPALASGLILLATLRLITPAYKPVASHDRRSLRQQYALGAFFIATTLLVGLFRVATASFCPYHLIELVLVPATTILSLLILTTDQLYLRDHNLFHLLYWSILLLDKLLALGSIHDPAWQMNPPYTTSHQRQRLVRVLACLLQCILLLLACIVGFATSHKRSKIDRYQLYLFGFNATTNSNDDDDPESSIGVSDATTSPNSATAPQSKPALCKSSDKLGSSGMPLSEKEAWASGELYMPFAVSFSRRCTSLLPYVWPTGSLLAQLSIVACFFILICGRLVNILLPIYYKNVINELNGNSVQRKIPYTSLGIYVGLMLLQGGGAASNGLLGNARSFLWINVQQHTIRRLKINLFSHIHHFSLDWHLKKKTGEVLRVMDRGTDSISSLLSSILFNIIPTILDIAVAIVYFVVVFDALFGMVVLATMLTYMVATVLMTEWRTQIRKAMNQKDKLTYGVAVDSLMNYETIKYFTAEEYEKDKYETAFKAFQNDEWYSLTSLSVLNTLQNFTIQTGLLIGALLCCYRIIQGYLTPGDFVLFVAYILQLYQPLNWFGTYWRSIQQNFVDMENMLDLLDLESSIVDAPDAYTFPARNRPIIMAQENPLPPSATEFTSESAVEPAVEPVEIVFDRVSFAYNQQLVLKNISFRVPKGKTFALVGTSGGGKSTTMRLLLRFYDPQQGRITIDGHDIRKLTQKSLRELIGVVPQDTVLFNDTMYFNISYGRQGASEQDVKEAARASEIEHRILQFPAQYETMVGERGLRLSGGEKQRVAIARVMLKAPPIIVLDEATSALDTETERNIQRSLNRVCKGRTTLVIAHRLSTIIKADCILVFQNGSIVEQGTFDELVSKRGIFSNMWSLQLTEESESLV